MFIRLIRHNRFCKRQRFIILHELLLFKMRCKLQGFRGFSKDADYIDLSDLNVLIGKNSSGKSTIIKFLKMLSTSFVNGSNFEDLFQLKVKIGTELIGGYDHIKNSEDTKSIFFFLNLDLKKDKYIEEIKFHFVFNEMEELVLEKIYRIEYQGDKYNEKIIDYESELSFLKPYVEAIQTIVFIEPNRFISNRTFNIFNDTNPISQFLYWYKVKTKRDSNPGTKDISFSRSSKDLIHDFLDKYIKLFRLGLSVDIKIIESRGKIIVNKVNGSFDIYDEGSGFNNIIKLILILAMNIDYGYAQNQNDVSKKLNIIVVEEPERNLHPDLQSALAVLLVDLVNHYGHTLIVETHSEYLVRNLQLLVAKNRIKPDKVMIHYVEFNKTIEFKKIEIKDDGSLTGDFGTGFFDVCDATTKLMFEQQNQN